MKANYNDPKKIAFLGERDRKGNSSPLGHSRSNRMAAGSQSRGVCTALRRLCLHSHKWVLRNKSENRDTDLEILQWNTMALTEQGVQSSLCYQDSVINFLWSVCPFAFGTNTPDIALHITEMRNASSLFRCSSWEFIYHPLTKTQIKLLLLFMGI